MSAGEFGENLKTEGYHEEIRGQVRQYTKGSMEYDVCPDAKSTGEPAAQLKVNGRTVLKIRLRP